MSKASIQLIPIIQAVRENNIPRNQIQLYQACKDIVGIVLRKNYNNLDEERKSIATKLYLALFERANIKQSNSKVFSYAYTTVRGYNLMLLKSEKMDKMNFLPIDDFIFRIEHSPTAAYEWDEKEVLEIIDEKISQPNSSRLLPKIRKEIVSGKFCQNANDYKPGQLKEKLTTIRRLFS